MSLVRVIDLETTGNSTADGGVVEIGWQDVIGDANDWRVDGAPGATLINPGKPITPNTAAIHHIIDADVVDAPGFQHAAPDILRAAPGPAPAALAAHRAAFEQRWCTPNFTGGLPWICTYKCALRLWPDAPTHSNQGLRYWRMPESLDRATGLPAHRAGPDAYVTAHHLRDMLALADLQTLLAWSAEPALLVRVPFGPFRGRRWDELDDASLEQVISGGNADVAFTRREEIARRSGKPKEEKQAVLF